MPLPIAALRAAAIKKHKAAAAKVARLKAKGIDVADTAYDPRKTLDAVKKYNSKQLAAYTEKLDAFNARTRKFVATKDGSIVDPQRWANYKLFEKQYNKLVKADADKYGDLKPPGSGYSIREREEIRAKVKGGANTENLIFAETNRNAGNISNAESLDKLENQLVNRLGDEYRSFHLRANRDSAYEMIDRIGSVALKGEVAALSDEAFYVLWNKTRFLEVLKEIYLSMLEAKRNGKSYVPDDLSDVFELVRWAAEQYPNE